MATFRIGANDVGFTFDLRENLTRKKLCFIFDQTQDMECHIALDGKNIAVLALENSFFSVKQGGDYTVNFKKSRFISPNGQARQDDKGGEEDTKWRGIERKRHDNMLWRQKDVHIKKFQKFGFKTEFSEGIWDFAPLDDSGEDRSWRPGDNSICFIFPSLRATAKGLPNTYSFGKEKFYKVFEEMRDDERLLMFEEDKLVYIFASFADSYTPKVAARYSVIYEMELIELGESHVLYQAYVNSKLTFTSCAQTSHIPLEVMMDESVTRDILCRHFGRPITDCYILIDGRVIRLLNSYHSWFKGYPRNHYTVYFEGDSHLLQDDDPIIDIMETYLTRSTSFGWRFRKGSLGNILTGENQHPRENPCHECSEFSLEELYEKEPEIQAIVVPLDETIWQKKMNEFIEKWALKLFSFGKAKLILFTAKFNSSLSALAFGKEFEMTSRMINLKAIWRKGDWSSENYIQACVNDCLLFHSPNRKECVLFIHHLPSRQPMWEARSFFYKIGSFEAIVDILEKHFTVTENKMPIKETLFKIKELKEAFENTYSNICHTYG